MSIIYHRRNVSKVRLRLANYMRIGNGLLRDILSRIQKNVDYILYGGRGVVL